MSAITPVQILKTLSSSTSSSDDVDSLKKLQKVAQSTAADSTDSINDDSFFTDNDSAKTRILQSVQACQAISKYTLESARTAPTSPTLTTKTRRASFGPLEHHFHAHHLSLHPALDKQFKAHVISGSTGGGQGGGHEGPISILLRPANLAKEGGGEGDHAIWVVKGEAGAQWVMPYSSDNDHDLIDRHTHFDAHGHDLLDHVRTTLLNQLRQKRVVFTGHGSGAAVVSWVYMQLLREIKESDKADLAPHGMDLITFGAAATRWAEQRASLYTSKAGSETSTDAVKRYFTEKNPNTNLCLALINEGDPTPRLSKDYVAWISSAVSVADGDETKVKEALAKTPWHALLPFGQIVVLSADQKSSVRWIGKETFRQTVWVDPAQGDIDAYVTNVERLCK